MPREIFPSSYVCDCGHQSDFFENTIREIKAMSRKKKVRLGDSDIPEHTIIDFRRKVLKVSLSITRAGKMQNCSRRSYLWLLFCW
jgi:hypothetical protein